MPFPKIKTFTINGKILFFNIFPKELDIRGNLLGWSPLMQRHNGMKIAGSFMPKSP